MLRQEAADSGANSSKFMISSQAFDALWRKTSPVKMSARINDETQNEKRAEAKSAGIYTVIVKGKKKHGGPGDLTRQFSQVIDEAHKLTQNRASKDARRTVIGLPDCSSISSLKWKSATMKGIQLKNRIRVMRPTEQQL